MSLLAAESLSFSYPSGPASSFSLQDVSFSMEKGDLLGVLGPNGSGKSTLLRLLCRVLKPRSGRFTVSGQSLEDLSQKCAARRVALVPQEMISVFPVTVEQMVSLGRYSHGGWWGGHTPRDQEIVASALRQTDLWAIRDRLTTHLSGGERRRVLLARALAQEPQVLLLDEPTAHLDPHHQMDLLHLVEKRRTENGLAVVAVLHDVHLAMEWCPRSLLMKDGRVVAQGRTADVLTPELLERVYEIPVEVTREAGTDRKYVNFFHTLRNQEEASQ
ncbi:MAG: ABC transporter ATP-binding protein [Elusimicrobia bacterium]|nr:ABC transporter ATP-binding protein [Elusimicrobiota bacterium]